VWLKKAREAITEITAAEIVELHLRNLIETVCEYEKGGPNIAEAPD
jgi:hypothetical protein